MTVGGYRATEVPHAHSVLAVAVFSAVFSLPRYFEYDVVRLTNSTQFHFIQTSSKRQQKS